MTIEDYRQVAPTLPHQPGIYKFLGADDVIIYIGKAKNLKKRLASYFGNKKHQRRKTKALVRNAVRFVYTIVETEQDALLLESTLIKRHQPRYNVQLKDGKSYPYICIKNERFPRVFVTRRVFKDGSTYFGPYVSKYKVEIILEIIGQLFQLRTCTFNLSEENINKKKFKVCLEYHIKNCKGACEGLESEEEYNEKIKQIKNMLQGKFRDVKRHLKSEMQIHAENLAFEKAQKAKDKLLAFEDYQGKSTVVNPRIDNIDVFSIDMDEKSAYVNYLKVANGSIIRAFTLEMTKNLNDEKADLLILAVLELRTRFESISPEIVLPFNPGLELANVQITVPKIGDKLKLLELSSKNVRYFRMQKQKQELKRSSKQTSAERILQTMKADLNMSIAPMHIECFDNSNISGAFPVASMVVFKNAKPFKSAYRHYNIKTVVGPDDFASMEEVVFRRYRRLLDEEADLPQLVVIDGGKGQLSAAVKSLVALNLMDRILIIGIAKKLEEIYFPGDPIPLYLNKRSESLKVIQHIRNEAHRFAITFHRNQRSKNFTSTELTEIPGIGDKTAEKLLKHFKSVKQIKAASRQELEELVGKGATKKIESYFKAEE